MNATIRVHESNSDKGDTVSFNLDDWAQYERYIDTLAVRKTVRERMTKRMPHKVAFFLATDFKTNNTVSISAELETNHGDCALCRIVFDTSAGNGTRAA